MSAEVQWVYGYGRTKHIYGHTEEARNFFGRGYVRNDFGLCGAAGGYPEPQPERPVCKRCEKAAAKRAANGPTPAASPAEGSTRGDGGCWG